MNQYKIYQGKSWKYKKYSLTPCACAWDLSSQYNGEPGIFHLVQLDKGKIDVKAFIDIMKTAHNYNNFEIVSWLKKYNNKEINIYAE